VNRWHGWLAECQRDLLQRRLAAIRVTVGALDVARHLFGCRRQEPIHVVLEQSYQFGTALAEPILRGGYAPSVQQDQWIRQLILRYQFGCRWESPGGRKRRRYEQHASTAQRDQSVRCAADKPRPAVPVSTVESCAIQTRVHGRSRVR